MVTVTRAFIDFLPLSLPDFSASCTAFSIARCEVTPRRFKNLRISILNRSSFIGISILRSSVRPKGWRAYQTNLHCSFALPYMRMRGEMGPHTWTHSNIDKPTQDLREVRGFTRVLLRLSGLAGMLLLWRLWAWL